MRESLNPVGWCILTVSCAPPRGTQTYASFMGGEERNSDENRGFQSHMDISLEVEVPGCQWY